MRLAAFAGLTDIVLLLLRCMIGLIFCTSGWKHLTDAEARSKSIEMSKGFTQMLGAAECLAGLGVVLGVFTQFAAIGLIVIMFGAIWKKIFRWHMSFWGPNGTDGWSYEVLMILMNLIIVTTAGGRFAVERLYLVAGLR